MRVLPAALPAAAPLLELSHAVLALCFLLVAAAVLYLGERRRDPLTRTWLRVAAAMMSAAGVAHALTALAPWLPLPGWPEAAWVLAAGLAIVHVAVLARAVPRILALSSRAELERVTRELEAEAGERRRAEAALRAHQEALEQEVAARTAELEQTAQALQREIAGRAGEEQRRLELERQVHHGQKLESLGLLAGGIAHDFNNLLMGILGNTEVALQEVPPGSPLRTRLDQVKSASLVAADLTRQMLAYAGKGRFVTRHLSLNAVVEELTQLLQASVPKKTALRFNLAPDLPSVLADPAQMHQVVMNLITNAAEAVGDRPGMLTVTTGEMEAGADFLAHCLPAAPRPPGRYVFLEVADTGAGMDEATRQRIFEPFFTTKFTGRGLGLSAVEGIMRGHGGAVHVESAPGQGTRMRVLMLPAADAAPVAPATPAPTQYHGRGATVLVVDDEPLVRNALSAMLKSLGFTVLTAGDGQEGVDLFRANKTRVTAVLLDLTMPRMSGEDAFHEMRRIQPNVRVILCSGYSEQEAAGRFAGQGVAGFLQKPFGLDSISTRLREALNGEQSAAS